MTWFRKEEIKVGQVWVRKRSMFMTHSWLAAVKEVYVTNVGENVVTVRDNTLYPNVLVNRSIITKNFRKKFKLQRK